MSDIPSEIFREILIRLPAESVCRFKFVCKSWLHMIDDPSFVKEHTNNQLYSHTILVRHRSGALVYSLSLDSLSFTNGPQMIDATQVKKLFRRGMPRVPLLTDIAFCNGLVILTGEWDSKQPWAIWNPVTKELHELPSTTGLYCRLPQPFPDSVLWNIYGLGFGYDCVADDYKVVKIIKRDKKFQTLVYSLRSESWSEVENCPGPCSTQLGAFLNGSLYWVSENRVVALNLATGSYSHLPFPPVNIRFESVKNIGFWYYLDSLEGSLICSFHYGDSHLFEAWVMKDNGVEKSWSKLFSLQYLQCLSHKIKMRTGELRLVAYLKSTEQVVLQHYWGFLWIDIGTNSIKKFSIHGLPHISSARICPGSLVRLNRHRAIEGAVSRPLTKKRKRKTEGTSDKRLKVCVRNFGELCCSDNHFCSEVCCKSCKEE